MPVIEARWEPMARAFVVVLPGGIALPAPTEWDVTELVRKHAPGSALRWVYPQSSAASPLAAPHRTPGARSGSGGDYTGATPLPAGDLASRTP
jgi:hypothetical protein